MSLSRFILIDFQIDNPKLSLKQDTTFFFDEITSTLSKFLDYEITKEGKINLILCKNNLPFYSTFEEMQIDLSYEKNYQIIIEYNKVNRKVLAFHDYFFSQSPQRNLYRVSMKYLYLLVSNERGLEIQKDIVFPAFSMKDIPRHCLSSSSG